MARELSRRLPALDGLRALAVAAVFIAHSNFYLAHRPNALQITAHFREGVDLFFAISRAFRILPPILLYLAVLALLAIAGLVHASRWEFPSSLLFYRNYLEYRSDGGLLTGHFWSLSVEEHFYLMWPFCIGWLARQRSLILAIVVALLVAVWRAADAHAHLFARLLPDAGVLFRTDTRLDALLWGAAAGLILPRVRHWARWKPGALLPFAAMATIVASQLFSLPAIPVIRAAGYAMIVLSAVVWFESPAIRWLGTPWLERIGVLSYSLYIWQTLWLQSELLPRFAGGIPVPARWLLALTMTGLSAMASFYLIEQPARNIGYRLAGGRVAPPAPIEKTTLADALSVGSMQGSSGSLDDRPL